MGLIRKVNIDEYKENLTEAQLVKMEILEKELSPSSEIVKLGEEFYQIDSFDMTSSVSFSKFQSEYRDILRENPSITFEELLTGDDNIVKKILSFLGLSDVDYTIITYKQFKYLMYIITKNYIFTEAEERNDVNAMSPFFFV